MSDNPSGPTQLDLLRDQAREIERLRNENMALKARLAMLTDAVDQHTAALAQMLAGSMSHHLEYIKALGTR